MRTNQAIDYQRPYQTNDGGNNNKEAMSGKSTKVKDFRYWFGGFVGVDVGGSRWRGLAGLGIDLGEGGFCFRSLREQTTQPERGKRYRSDFGWP